MLEPRDDATSASAHSSSLPLLELRLLLGLGPFPLSPSSTGAGDAIRQWTPAWVGTRDECDSTSTA